mmetsp:Transcript_25648/g.59585  ORF Transcript_25648/g.59585 Transcript_25648/m.59585 type:complete len:200 (-) Transcript_25648:414-1013(-)
MSTEVDNQLSPMDDHDSPATGSILLKYALASCLVWLGGVLCILVSYFVASLCLRCRNDRLRERFILAHTGYFLLYFASFPISYFFQPFLLPVISVCFLCFIWPTTMRYFHHVDRRGWYDYDNDVGEDDEDVGPGGNDDTDDETELEAAPSEKQTRMERLNEQGEEERNQQEGNNRELCFVDPEGISWKYALCLCHLSWH